MDTEPGEYFTVRDDVWQAANPWNEHGGSIRFLCVGCLEHRIGRRLEPADFPPVPINDPGSIDSDRLAARKRGEGVGSGSGSAVRERSAGLGPHTADR